MRRTPEEFQKAFLDVLQEGRYGTPSVWEEYLRNHLTPEGARVYALEHCVFAANFPRWLSNIAGNCPYLDVRKYLIENMYVEEVSDPTITTNHYESMVDFTVALGIDREYILSYTGAPLTRMRIVYSDWVSRHTPWLEAMAAIEGDEVSRGSEMIKRVGERARTSRVMWAKLGLSDKALEHWDGADAADSEEGGHGDLPLVILKKYADTEEKQAACLEAARERQATNRVWFDQIGVWAYEASGLTPPSLEQRHPVPAPRLALATA
jgi:hypothetical protein